MRTKMIMWFFPLVVLAVLVSVRFLDVPIALAAMELQNFSDLLRTSVSNIPDILFLLVCCGSGFFWGNYFMHKRRGTIDEYARFSRLAGSVLPLAYFLKGFFKYVFGRTNTRIWIANGRDDGFHWFNYSAEYSSFPSGHMAVFTAFFAAVWLCYPRYRSISFGLLLALAMALIVTDYHFLSDVIAGAYLGLITTSLTKACLERVWL